VLARSATLVFRPSLGERLSAQRNPAARDLIRHAFADVGGNVNRARSWARFARRWPTGAQRELLDAYSQIRLPVLLLWADEDPAHPLVGAQEALDLLPDAQLRTLPGTGFLMAYDDPVSVARELIAFCG
jgi:pimeloyl-ACP methyl ester carboxylesterase